MTGPAAPAQKIVVVASLAWSLINFRGQLLADLVAAGHDVLAVAPEHDADVEHQLAARGVRYQAVAMRRASLSIGSDLAFLASLVALFRRERPTLVLAYTQKPIVYAGLAARMVDGIRFFAMCTGLGHAFSAGGGMRRTALRWIVARLYRHALHGAAGLIVFNSDDHAEMRHHGMIGDGLPVERVSGSGIDTGRFAAAAVPAGPPVFLLVARLLRNKGLVEYVEAARRIKTVHPEVRFQLLGPFDQNPASISPREIAAWEDEGIIEYLGETRDVAPFFAAASVFVLPTWYREGLPRTILEAMATGRAVIASDAPGCRDAVSEGFNGFLVPVRNAAALATAMQRFVDDPALAGRLGRNARSLAEKQYDVRCVNRHLMTFLGLKSGSVAVPVAVPITARRDVR